MIKEVIVVEGRDDEQAVNRAVEASTIATHGFGIAKATWDLIEKAYQERGIIVFTDPDFAGEQIRKRITARFPEAKQAYLTQEEAWKNGDIGIENANPEDIRDALGKARATAAQKTITFSQSDLFELGLAGGENAAELRNRIGRTLGIGYGNTKLFLRRLNEYGITREELEHAWTSCIQTQRSEK
ncbi:MAG: ribonuclease M5 [Firmicutes bacterium]|nr:ribonuclease M5 [Bacillota bacterium]